MEAPMQWLLAGEPWVAYRTRCDLLGQAAGEPELMAARQAMLAHPLVRQLVDELAGWPGTVVASHKSAGQPFHRLAFLADLGLVAGDPGVNVIVEAILQHQAAEGPFQLPAPVGAQQDGPGVWGWALCDAPLLVYALARFGLGETPEVRRAMESLVGLVRANGWPCAVAPVLHFRGPGRKEDPCPYANLVMLKALATFDAWRTGEAAHTGTETLLSLWADSLTRHPYIFYMGTDFRKLKVPFIWYDLVHVLDVLARFPWVHGDPRFQEMVSLLRGKAGPNGEYTLESVWTAWKAWEFGQKQTPSRWLTLVAWRILSCGNCP